MGSSLALLSFPKVIYSTDCTLYLLCFKTNIITSTHPSPLTTP